MDIAQYKYEVKEFIRNHGEHSLDFKVLVLRLLILYDNNVKLVSAITYVPETIILEWQSDWHDVIDKHPSALVEFVNDGSDR